MFPSSQRLKRGKCFSKNWVCKWPLHSSLTFSYYCNCAFWITIIRKNLYDVKCMSSHQFLHDDRQISANCNRNFFLFFVCDQIPCEFDRFEIGFDLMTEKNDLVGSSLQISFSADCYQGQFLISQVHISTFHFHCKEIWEFEHNLFACLLKSA